MNISKGKKFQLDKLICGESSWKGQKSHCGMVMQASADGSLQVLKQGTTQESYLHWHRGPGGASGLGPDEKQGMLNYYKPTGLLRHKIWPC